MAGSLAAPRASSSARRARSSASGIRCEYVFSTSAPPSAVVTKSEQSRGVTAVRHVPIADSVGLTSAPAVRVLTRRSARSGFRCQLVRPSSEASAVDDLGSWRRASQGSDLAENVRAGALPNQFLEPTVAVYVLAGHGGCRRRFPSCGQKHRRCLLAAEADEELGEDAERRLTDRLVYVGDPSG